MEGNNSISWRAQGKTAVITGGAAGIGKEIAKTFLINGAKAVIIDINAEKLSAAEKELTQYGEVKSFAADVTNSGDVDNVFDKIISAYGKIDILVNNAGITDDARLVKMSDEQLDRVLRVNVKGVFNCSRKTAAHMLEKGCGKIINISSVVGIYGNFGQTNYAASKSAVIGMTKTWAKELGPKGINVNAVAPGFIQTDMTDKMPEKIIENMKEKIPLHRLGKPGEIAGVCLFLASDSADYINGAVISVDGGIVL
jgi:3-oxoacyl-[acyl-carrier protein] reductase